MYKCLFRPPGPQAPQTPHLAIRTAFHAALTTNHASVPPSLPPPAVPAATPTAPFVPCSAIKAPICRPVIVIIIQPGPCVMTRKRHAISGPRALWLLCCCCCRAPRRGRQQRRRGPQALPHANIARPLPAPLAVAVRVEIRAHLGLLVADVAGAEIGPRVGLPCSCTCARGETVSRALVC
jgi:hypothetical protein